MRIIFFLIILLFSNGTFSEIYRCIDSNGITTYSDQKCEKDNELVKTIEPKINILPSEVKTDINGKALKTIYTGSVHGRNSRFLKVSIYEETDAYIIFYVEGYYNGPSNGRVEFRVMPNIHWRASSFSTSDYGKSSGYARIGLGSKEKEVAQSDVITLQLWQYSPGKSPTILETKVVPFKKEWVKK